MSYPLDPQATGINSTWVVTKPQMTNTDFQKLVRAFRQAAVREMHGPTDLEIIVTPKNGAPALRMNAASGMRDDTWQNAAAVSVTVTPFGKKQQPSASRPAPLSTTDGLNSVRFTIKAGKEGENAIFLGNDLANALPGAKVELEPAIPRQRPATSSGLRPQFRSGRSGNSSSRSSYSYPKVFVPMIGFI